MTGRRALFVRHPFGVQRFALSFFKKQKKQKTKQRKDHRKAGGRNKSEEEVV
jgi:hypothetical protein